MSGLEKMAWGDTGTIWTPVEQFKGIPHRELPDSKWQYNCVNSVSLTACCFEVLFWGACTPFIYVILPFVQGALGPFSLHFVLWPLWEVDEVKMTEWSIVNQ